MTDTLQTDQTTPPIPKEDYRESLRRDSARDGMRRKYPVLSAPDPETFIGPWPKPEEATPEQIEFHRNDLEERIQAGREAADLCRSQVDDRPVDPASPGEVSEWHDRLRIQGLSILSGFRTVPSSWKAREVSDRLYIQGKPIETSQPLHEVLQTSRTRWNPHDRSYADLSESEKAIMLPELEPEAARFLIETRGYKIEEVIEEMGLNKTPNAVAQMVHHVKNANPYNTVRLTDAKAGDLVCVYILNDRTRVHTLCPGDSTPDVIEKAKAKLLERLLRTAYRNNPRRVDREAAMTRVELALRNAHIVHWVGGLFDTPDTDDMNSGRYEGE